ncbi:hypothetical protein OSSY52_15470 [Tepiditoga spiralis]|uniref:Flagellar protein FliT n=1 Tax=Tepiditoga spiralis TaxID=2108365 RepID=A0A7G1G7P9_9BACT|nr:hypothetical protein [Tepiditoga spiralis]BBE31406.1 hypothetical protein OSSY52_15470 [Tepiditoga spiralis]
MDKELDNIINELEKIEIKLDLFYKKGDFVSYNNALDFRFKLLKKLQIYNEEKRVKEIIQKIIKKDEIRKDGIKEKMNNIKKQQVNLQTGKRAIKNGYYNIQEGLRRKKIDKSG